MQCSLPAGTPLVRASKQAQENKCIGEKHAHDFDWGAIATALGDPQLGEYLEGVCVCKHSLEEV